VAQNPVAELLAALVAGEVELVDLTNPLKEGVPVFPLPEPLVNTPGLTMRLLSDYDERGPSWRWHALEVGEHAGTHFDAPCHWISGRGGEAVGSVPVEKLVGPVCVIDKSAEVAAEPGFLLTAEDVVAWEDEHGLIPDGAWVLLRTGWSAHIDDHDKYLTAGTGEPLWPGPDVGCMRFLTHERSILGWGAETIGTDAGGPIPNTFDPALPAHWFLSQTGKYGLAQLAGLDRLPATGALLVAAPLRLVNGTGSPARVLAFVPRGAPQG
jgi:kynurenine formamidase